MRRELLCGSGARKNKQMCLPPHIEWEGLVTLDLNPDCKPDLIWDLEKLPYPFQTESFDEIHAYEVLEHIGDQGDWRTFFAQFTEFHRILKPNGLFFATVPMWNGLWAWSDPSHRRVISEGTLVFLSQAEYERQVGTTAMTDFRHWYKGDFEIAASVKDEINQSFRFILKALK